MDIGSQLRSINAGTQESEVYTRVLVDFGEEDSLVIQCEEVVSLVS